MEIEKIQATLAAKKKMSKGCLWLIIVNAVLWTTLAIVLVYSLTKPVAEDPRFLAYVMVKHVISENLKAPSTAEFQPYEESLVTGNGHLFQMTIWVDSENSFGAMLRTKFTAQVKYDGKNYNLTYLKKLKN